MSDKTIIDNWTNVVVPSPPELSEVIIDCTTTALLVLDIQTNNCNEEKRPSCIKSVPKIAQLLSKARSKGMLIVYALTSNATIENIRSEVTPHPNDPVVKSSVDKFYNTELAEILERKNITRVIIVGTSAHGAVLHTATGASMRKLKIIIPIDGLSASDSYAEQYTVWHLANAPGTRRNVLLTKTSLITFQ